MSVAEIRCELCAAVYGQNVMSDGTVRQWCRMCKDERTDIHDEERSGQPFITSDGFFKLPNKKIVKDGASQFQNFRVNFHKVHALLSMRLSQARLSQVLRKMGSENVHRCAQNAGNGFGFGFLERNHKDGDEFISHIV
jgi:hypothetical protein